MNAELQKYMSRNEKMLPDPVIENAGPAGESNDAVILMQVPG